MDDTNEGSLGSKPSCDDALEGPVGTGSRPRGDDTLEGPAGEGSRSSEDEQHVDNSNGKPVTLSKSQLKKIKKKEKWNQVKAEKR